MTTAVREFLTVATSARWADAAIAAPDVLLIDHANCEKKAAGTALSLLYRYVDRPELLTRLSQLAREELLHFEQVHALMRRRGVTYRHLSASRYAGRLHAEIASHEPARLVDTLIVAAVVEARSCERFDVLGARLDDELGALYRRLEGSERRHFEVYLELARQHADATIDFDSRVADILARDAELITSPDPVLRFHSGEPVAA